MNIVMMKLSDLTPYDKNPRKNDDAVKYVKASIKEFGFKVPIVIDKDNVIIAGHTRYKASKELNIDEVPCIIADDLTEEQIKAFRLADNKVSEAATWDMELLDEELDGIFDIDMSLFDFNIDLEPTFDELERDTEHKDELIIKIVFETHEEWLKYEDALRELVKDAKANMVVGSI